VTGDALTPARLERLDDVIAGHVHPEGVPGAVWLVAQRGRVHVGVAGTLGADGQDPMTRDSIFRISSMTKPVTAVAALLLVEDSRLRLDDPVDRLLPELADRRVLARSDGPLDDTVPARRAITVEDLLTFRMGLGFDFAGGAQPTVEAMAELELGVGPPAPAGPPAPDEWMRRLGTVPLAHQPGERWLYHTGADVLGVLVARAADQPFEAFLAERIFEPLGMADTGFAVPADKLARVGPLVWPAGDDGRRQVYDPADGQWSTPPAFPGGGAGLVSTVDDYLAFAEMLRAGGTYRGQRVLSRGTVDAMTTNHLTSEQIAASGPDPSGTQGWGFGVSVQMQRTGPARSVGTYGWDGGLGTSWATDPAQDLVGILMTNQTWMSPDPPPVCQDFWTYAAAIDD
jgi:CubicO group peptidase (beta-lactamase class C family)